MVRQPLFFSKQHQPIRKYLHIITLLVFVFSLYPIQGGVQAATSLTITPITWNIVGLDSNNVNVGPNNFPVGARVCNSGDSPATNVTSTFVWDSTDVYINLRSGSLSSYAGSTAVTSLAAGSCKDFYYEISITRSSSAYNHTRRYHITASSTETGLTSTVTPREIFVEHLVSQNRNSVDDVKLDGVSVPDGGIMNLKVGGTYNIQLIGSTSTNGYNQLESFINLTNTIFRINSVTSTYGVTSLNPPYDRLYADSCGWDNNPLSPTYRSCILSDGKTGGQVTVNYNVTVISGGGTSQILTTLLYDFSGSSFHYNSDFTSSARTVTISSPLSFSKSFSPASIAAGGTSKLTFSLTNPTSTAVSGASFSDALPATPGQMQVAATPDASLANCGLATYSADPDATSVSLSNATILAGETCTFSLDVTVPVEGVYTNISNDLLINDIDTGLTASAKLTDAANSTGSGLCGVTLAKWTMDPSQGTTVPPLPSFKAADVAIAQIYVSSGVNDSINTTVGSVAVNSLQGTGFSTSASLDPVNEQYFRFVIDTHNYTAVKMDLNHYRVSNGPQNLAVYYGTATTLPQTFKATYTVNTSWTAMPELDFSGATSTTGNTYFFVYGYHAGNNGNDADLVLDDITFTGCGSALKPTLTKAFSPATIAAGGTSTLTFTLSNPNSVALTLANFNDPLPVGLVVAATPAASTTCTAATFAPTAGDTGLSFSGGTIPANGSCTAQVNVTAAAAGVYQNVSGYLSTSESGTNTGAGGSASAVLTVLAAPGFSKEFSPNPIYAGGISTLTFTLTNPNSTPLTQAGFTDPLPSGLIVASPPAANTTCSGASFAPTAGDTSLSFSGGTIPANGSCTAQVDVTAAGVGDYANTSSALSSGYAGLNANPATDTLTVITHYPGLKLLKQVSTSASGPWSSFLTTAPGSDIYYRLTVENIGDVDLTTVSVTDPWLSLAGCALATSFTLTTADPIASCDVGPLSAAAGDTLNTAMAAGDYNGASYTSSSTAEYVGVTSAAYPDLSLVKQVSTSRYGPWETSITGVNNGADIYYKFTAVNSGNTELSGLSINDLLVNTSGCELIDPLAAGAATACVVGPITATLGIHPNTATAESSTPAAISSESSATYTTGAYSLSGTVWVDSDGNGLIGSSEPGLFDVTLKLYLDDGNQAFDGGDTFLGYGYTAADGSYSFADLPNGDYFVQVADGVTGYTLVSGGANPRLVNLSGEDSLDNNFGYQYPPIDLGVTKDDGATTVDAAGTTTYTIRVVNYGPDVVSDARLSDTVLSGLALTGAACTGAVGNQCSVDPDYTALAGGISLPLLAKDAFYEIAVTANVTATTGTASNQANIAPPAGVTDPVSGNDTSTDTDTVNPLADLGVVKDDGLATVDAGGTTTYTIRVTNYGPSSVSGAILTDTVLGGLTLIGAACTGAVGNQCSVDPDYTALAGGISLPLLAKDAFYEIAVTANVTAATGTASNQAVIVVPEGPADPDNSNNTSTDTDTVYPVTDLGVVKDNSVTSVTAGGVTTYTITVTNYGPTTVSDAMLTDTVLSGLHLTAATCSLTPGNTCSGPVNLAALTSTGIFLPALADGDFYQIQVTADVTSPSGLASNQASVAPPQGIKDENPANDQSTDSDPINPAQTPSVDLGVTKDDGATTVDAGGTTTYTIRVTNYGPSSVSGATLTDAVLGGLTLTGAACTGTAGNQCSVNPDYTALVGGISLPALARDAFYEIAVTANVTATTGTASNQATVAVPLGTTDPVSRNDSSTDTDNVLKNVYKVYLPFTVWQRVETWTAEWDVTLGFEDLPLKTGANDFDYNDWTVDVNSVISYSINGTNSLMNEIKMVFVPQARGGAYQHEFQVRLPAKLLASSGKVIVTIYDQGHQVLGAQTTPFASGEETLLTIFPNTADVFPGSIVNTIEGQPDDAPKLTADVQIVFDTPFAFNVNASDLSQPHGEGLFFDPLLNVLDTGEQIHSGDVRLLSVPSTHWLWPEEGVRIDRAYQLVVYDTANPLNFSFPDSWWTNFNHCVYDGVVCGTP
jgi:uncharacterized repeat protein (TIGR01451 family)